MIVIINKYYITLTVRELIFKMSRKSFEDLGPRAKRAALNKFCNQSETDKNFEQKNDLERYV